MNANEVQPESTRSYPSRLPKTWWLRHRRYFIYVVRDLSPGAGILWLLVFLFEIRQLNGGPAGYSPFHSLWFVALSVFCLAATLFHSVTWFSLSAVVLRIQLGKRILKPRTVAAAIYVLFVLVSAIGAFLLVWLAK